MSLKVPYTTAHFVFIDGTAANFVFILEFMKFKYKLTVYVRVLFHANSLYSV